LARRATFFKSARETPGTVILSGGYELSPTGLETDRHPSVVRNIKRAYELLGYDIAFMSPADATVFSHVGIDAGPAWKGPLAKPEVIERAVPGGSIAFILFPDSGEHDKGLEDETVLLAENLRKQARHNLIIGVSTWGADRELDFIERRGAVFDIIFGSGPGPGYAGLFLGDNGTLLVRAFTKGKSVHSVTIPNLPQPGSKIAWEPQVSVLTAATPLGGDVANDPQIDAIFNP
jgi:hypothetical protein